MTPRCAVFWIERERGLIWLSSSGSLAKGPLRSQNSDIRVSRARKSRWSKIPSRCTISSPVSKSGKLARISEVSNLRGRGPSIEAHHHLHVARTRSKAPGSTLSLALLVATWAARPLPAGSISVARWSRWWSALDGLCGLSSRRKVRGWFLNIRCTRITPVWHQRT